MIAYAHISYIHTHILHIYIISHIYNYETTGLPQRVNPLGAVQSITVFDFSDYSLDSHFLISCDIFSK